MEKSLIKVHTWNKRCGEGQSMEYNHRSDLLIVESEGSTVKITKAFCLGDDSGGRQVKPAEGLLHQAFGSMGEVLQALNYEDLEEDPCWHMEARVLDGSEALGQVLQASRRGVAQALLDWFRAHYQEAGDPATVWRDEPR